MTGVVQTTMTLLLWFSLSVSGISGQGKTLNDGMGSVLAFKDKNLLDWLIVTDLQMALFPLDAMLIAAFALFAALFFPPAALLDAAYDRGSAQPGLSPVVSLPLPPGFPSDGNSLATVAFSHLAGCLLRRAAISSRGYC